MHPLPVHVCVHIQRIFRLASKSGYFQDITDKRAICLIRQRTHTHMHMNMYMHI